ncbi:diguanylate cyclase domain-containing protein [Pseudidiomarina mangrovi]|uniref:diguanylate cyclase domain-containing protein n=1 Tax=Pseudidiomarina mangrovi TaxID=2487133 RepID=UPI000FCBF674|nr:diguanylate cyclase [Pseudidiomarina mangrovi]
MLHSSSKRALFVVATVSSLIIACIAIEYFHRLHVDRVEKEQLYDLQADFATLRSDLESELNASIYRSWGMLSYISAHPSSTTSDWLALSDELLRSANHIRNIAVAPDNVISFVYPMAGNEAVIGLDYSKVPDQLASVERAMASRDMIVAGPVNLRQGGTGIITRTPIFVNDGNSTSYWGVVSIVIDIPSLFAAVQLPELQNQYQITLQGRDALGARGEVFLGDPAVLADADALGTIRFASGSWVLAMKSVNGSAPSVWAAQRVRVVGYSFIALLYILLFGLFALYRESYGDSMHDPLTGIANRRLLMDRINTLLNMHQRTPTAFALINIDLNNFKAINDRHGHQAGDYVLQQIAERLKSAVRAVDTVARVGGDEFLVVMVGIDNPQLATEQSVKLLGKINQPLEWKGRTIDIYAALGWSLFPTQATTIDDLLQQADEMMYRQKTI